MPGNETFSDIFGAEHKHSRLLCELEARLEDKKTAARILNLLYVLQHHLDSSALTEITIANFNLISTLYTLLRIAKAHRIEEAEKAHADMLDKFGSQEATQAEVDAAKEAVQAEEERTIDTALVSDSLAFILVKYQAKVHLSMKPQKASEVLQLAYEISVVASDRSLRELCITKGKLYVRDQDLTGFIFQSQDYLTMLVTNTFSEQGVTALSFKHASEEQEKLLTAAKEVLDENKCIALKASLSKCGHASPAQILNALLNENVLTKKELDDILEKMRANERDRPEAHLKQEKSRIVTHVFKAIIQPVFKMNIAKRWYSDSSRPSFHWRSSSDKSLWRYLDSKKAVFMLTPFILTEQEKMLIKRLPKLKEIKRSLKEKLRSKGVAWDRRLYDDLTNSLYLHHRQVLCLQERMAERLSLLRATLDEVVQIEERLDKEIQLEDVPAIDSRVSATQFLLVYIRFFKQKISEEHMQLLNEYEPVLKYVNTTKKDETEEANEAYIQRCKLSL